MSCISFTANTAHRVTILILGIEMVNVVVISVITAHRAMSLVLINEQVHVVVRYIFNGQKGLE